MMALQVMNGQAGGLKNAPELVREPVCPKPVASDPQV
jgi:hypothetical protein